MSGRYRRDDRAVSVTVNHALTLAITAILVTGLVSGAATMLERQQETATRLQLESIGGDLVRQLNALDRLNDTGEAEAAVRATYPGRVSGTSYSVTLERTGSTSRGNAGQLVLETDDPDVTVTVAVHTDTALDDGVTRSGHQLDVRLCDRSPPALTLGRDC